MGGPSSDQDQTQNSLTYSNVAMDTLVSFSAITTVPEEVFRAHAEGAFGWFRYVEQVCSRFDPQSEMMQLCTQIGTPVKVSPLLFSLLDFALDMARATNGIFDPTVGRRMEQQGFNRNYITGVTVNSPVAADAQVSYRDVRLNRKKGTVTLLKPLVLDLGAVAKGMAIDLAAKALASYSNLAVEAGGDIYVRGHNSQGTPWHIGIRHPRIADALVCTTNVTDMAICTSGDYERKSSVRTGEHHLLNPATGRSPAEIASVTVLAPTALLSDALSTAVFLLGPVQGLRLLQEHAVEGCIITQDMELHTTPGFGRYRE